MKGFNTDAKTKLVPIDRDLAADCARAGRSTGRGYYATVNERLRAAGHMVPAAPVVRLVAAVTAMLPPQGAPSMLEALAMAEATIERLTVHHGPFSSTQGTLDVVRAAMVTAAAADRAELRGALVDVQRDTDHVDVTPGDGETAKQILRDLYK